MYRQLQRKIVVTGGAGHVASSLVERLVSNPLNFVTIIDNLSTGSRRNLPDPSLPNWAFLAVDVNDRKSLFKATEGELMDYVFHYAAVVGVARTQAYPTKVLQDIDGIRNVLDLACRGHASRVFYASSSEVYGEPVEIPQREATTPLNSKLPYAIVKNVGEAFLKSYQQTHGLDFTIMRLFNTYGPRQTADFVIAKFMAAALRGDDLLIYGDGLQTRTFLYVEDHLDCVEALLERDLGINDVINIGNDDEITVLDLARRIIAHTDSRSKIVHVPALKAGDMSRRCPDNSRMRTVLGRAPLSLEVGLERLMGVKV